MKKGLITFAVLVTIICGFLFMRGLSDDTCAEKWCINERMYLNEYCSEHSSKHINDSKEEKEEAERIRKQEAWIEAEKKKEEEHAEKVRKAREALENNK